MPADCDQSPRAAIQRWLSRTEPGAVSSEPQRTSNHRTRRSKPKRSIHRSQQLSPTIPGVDGHSHVRPLRASAKNRVSHEHHSRTSGRHEVSLAERLGLYAPFRTFKDEDGDGELGHGTDVAHRKTKRRRTVSSSSLLEPAEIDPGPRQEDAEGEGPCKPGAGTKGYSFHDDGINDSEWGSKPSNSPTRKPKSYERRSRHKTREDRYELKQDGKRPAKKQKKTGAAGKDRKRKRREKSGNTLMHDFTASNVAQDRLTIKPAASLGLFGKGRASSPVRRKGLPDLTFSEMTFLNSRSEQPKTTERQAAERTKRQKKDKTEDTEAAISRYFTSKCPRAGPGPGTGPRPDLAGVDLSPENSYDVRRLPSSSLPPVELPDRPFLGFGSSGASLTSPVKPGKHCGTPHGRSRPSLGNPSTADSTSYYTWSDTAHSTAHAPTPTHRHRSRSLQTGLASSRSVQASLLERTSVAPPDFAVPERAGHGSIRNAFSGERIGAKDVIRRETPNHRVRSDCEEPVSPAINTKDAYATAVIGDADAMRVVSGRSSRKHVPKEDNAQNRPHSEAQSLEKDPLVTNLACNTSCSFDPALEYLLHAGQKVLGTSAPPRNAIDVAVQHLPAVEFENGPSATPTIRASQREDATIPGRTYHFSTAQISCQAPLARAFDQPTHVYSQGQQCRINEDPTYPAVTQLTSPRIIHEPTKLQSYGSTAIDFSRSSESRAHSGGAWNAYQNLYQTQLMAISNDNYKSEDGLRGSESWVGEPSLDRRASFREVPYLGVEIPGEWERSPDRFFENNDPEQTVCEEANFASPFEQSIPTKDEGAPPDGMVSDVERHWLTRDNAFDSYICAPASSAQQDISDFSETNLLFSNPGPMATTFTTSSTYTAEARLMGERTEYQSYDHSEGWNEGANRRNSHLAVGHDEHLSNFWKPNRLY